MKLPICPLHVPHNLSGQQVGGFGPLGRADKAFQAEGENNAQYRCQESGQEG